MIFKAKKFTGTIALAACFGVTVAHAQTVPSDLVEVSLEELFATNVLSEAEEKTNRKRWHISYRYATSRFDEYYSGSNSLSYDDVLWRPGNARTTSNYPVVDHRH